MNEVRHKKLKRLILKLPLGTQLLQLRRNFILRHKKKKQEKILRRKEKEKIRQQQKAHKLQSITKQQKYLFNKAKLQNDYFYRMRSVKHLAVFKQYSQVPPEQATAFEIGAGQYLIAPIGLSLLGFGKVITVDVCCASPDYVQIVYQYYLKHQKKFGIRHIPKIKEKFTNENLTDILLRNFNIDYRAPYDAAHTDLPDNSVDYVFSYVTFEHIDVNILPDIVKESFRILRKGGIFYAYIDLKDHRAQDNCELTIYDYFQYTSVEWPQHEHNYLHQNRLRTADYQTLFVNAGFEVISLRKQAITDADRAAFATVKVADEFKNKYTDEELMEKCVWFVLRKP